MQLRIQKYNIDFIFLQISALSSSLFPLRQLHKMNLQIVSQTVLQEKALHIHIVAHFHSEFHEVLMKPGKENGLPFLTSRMW